MALIKHRRRHKRIYYLLKLIILLRETCIVSSLLSYAPCTGPFFQCQDGRCIPISFVCDDGDDCPNGDDEFPENCSKVQETECKENEFECGKGNCIPMAWKCDKENDCKDKSDESPEICQHNVCKNDEFTCHPTGNGTTCIPLNWVCDGNADCDDDSDERSCNATCTSEQFTCGTGKCIPLNWHCDSDPDCEDASDEEKCPEKECQVSETSCGDGECVRKSWICDGEQDCENGFDETDCKNATVLFSCVEGEVKCDRSLLCIPKNFLCDGDQDCPHGEDEHCNGCPEGHFMCGDKSCILTELRCNGFPECVDGSDEGNCDGRNIGTSQCNPETEFNCGRKCIPMKLACNGKEDCDDDIHFDEAIEICDRNECEEYNGGCSQICINKKVGHKCRCKKGFMLVNDTQCQDINECLEPGICSQVCRNLKGSYKCECVAGYAKDPHNTHKCKAMEGHASLLYADYYDIRKISLDHKEHLFQVTAIVNVTNGSTALDFVFKTGMIFWTDARDKRIYKAPIDEGTKRETVIEDDMTNTDGLAVDWIYNHIYWSNSARNTIEVSDFNGEMRKTLFRSELKEPRSIAIYPLEGWMFWTDWGQDSKIERAGMDGTHRSAIVTKDIRWPNGLTIDFVLRLLYWVDSKQHSISSCRFDGSGRRVILYSPEHLSHPFSITVFEDTLYWTDWEKHAILKTNKFTGKQVEVVSHSHQNPMTVHVYHSYRQPNGTNLCTPLNGLCTHLCLPAPQFNTSAPKIACACPDGLMLMSDSLTCESAEHLMYTLITNLDPFAKDLTVPEQSERSKEALMHEALADSPFSSLAEKVRLPAVPAIKTEGETLAEGSTSAAADEDGNVAVAAILAAILILCLTSAVAYLLYRYYRKRSAQLINFDNPVYKKTTTTEDGLNLSGSNRNSCSQNGIRGSQSQYPHRQYGVMSSEDSLEPLTKNHQFV